MNALIAIAGALGFVASICTVWMFVEDRIEKFRLRKRRKKMMSEKEEG